jgi:hypothetical protein
MRGEWKDEGKGAWLVTHGAVRWIEMLGVEVESVLPWIVAVDCPVRLSFADHV